MADLEAGTDTYMGFPGSRLRRSVRISVGEQNRKPLGNFLATRWRQRHGTSVALRQALVIMTDPYAHIKAHFEKVAGVTVNSGRGAQGLKVGKKMFAMFSKGDLLLKLPPARVEALIVSGRGLSYDPGTGKLLPNYVLIPVSQKRSWIKLCEEAAAASG